MQITIGCSYMQLGDKEQSMSHLQGPRMVLYTNFQWDFLAIILSLDLDRQPISHLADAIRSKARCSCY